MDEREQHNRLIQGLVGEEHLTLYRTNAFFHAGIDGLAQMLSFTVAGLAAEAEKRNAEQVQQMAALMHAPLLTEFP